MKNILSGARRFLLTAVLAAAVLTLSAVSVSAVIPTSVFDIPEAGLWFRFDGNAEEASGAVSGTLRGDPGFVEGRDGTADGAIWFETEEQSVLLGLEDIEGNWTASFWVKSSGVPYHAFLCSSLTGSLRLIQDDGFVGATMNGIVDRSVPYKVPNDTWTMLTFAYDNDMELTSVYVNGEFIDGMYGWQTLGLTLLGNDAPEQKGWQSAPRYALDDTWFFGRLLTDGEIRTLYETNAVPFPEKEEEPELPETEDETAEDTTEPETGPEEDGEDAPEPEDDPVEEAETIRERKPGGFAAMGVILAAAIFLICAGARAIFGRSAR